MPKRHDPQGAEGAIGREPEWLLRLDEDAVLRRPNPRVLDIDPPSAGTGDPFLPMTAYATLGMIAPESELTAVEIQRRAQLTIKFFYWTPALSHIRRELNRLEEHGFVLSSEVITQRGKRSVAYRVTPQGEAELQRWVDSGPIEPPVVKNGVMLRLWLGRRAGDPELVLDALRGHITRVEDERDSLIELMAFYSDYFQSVNDAADLDDPAQERAVKRSAWVREVMRSVLHSRQAELVTSADLLEALSRLKDWSPRDHPEGPPAVGDKESVT